MGTKHLMTLLVHKHVAQRVRKAVRETPTRYTISEVASRAMEGAAQLLERWYNYDRPFPKRKEELKGGRPPELEGEGAQRVPTERMTVYVDAAIAERFRNAVYYTPTHETISRVISRALNHAARKLERKRMVAERKKTQIVKGYT